MCALSIYESYDIVGVVPETRENWRQKKEEDKLRYAESKSIGGRVTSANKTMDVRGSDQESSLFQAFIVPSVGIENKNVNKINDPIVRI